MDALQPGDPRRVGRYRLLKRLGAGGMGRVYLGQSPSGRLVAVKVIRPELADDADFRQRFAQEVTAARRVSGIFTAPVVDADPDCSRPWMVTAFVAGPSLADAVGRQGPLPLDSLLTLAAGLAQGLGAVHAAGVVHRDLKPSNVLLASDGPRIIDFGISRAADTTGVTKAGGVVGSPGFMSPEQAEGHQVGPATDIFSLGGVLTYASTGEAPFGAGSASALLYRVVYSAAATGHVPEELRPLVERCLAKDPADRPSTDELLAELGYAEPAEDWLSWERPVVPIVASLPATELDQPPGDETGQRPADPRHAHPRPRRALIIGLAAAAVVAAAAIALGIGLARHHHADQYSAQGSTAALGTQPAESARKTGGLAETPTPSQTPANLGRPQTQPTAASPRGVVEAYFTAINEHDWQALWQLGGDNIEPSYRAMIAGYANTQLDVVRSIEVIGDHVRVRLRAYETNGTLQVYECFFTVRDGAIVQAAQVLLVAD